MSNQMPARITRLHSLQQLDELQDEWNQLYDASRLDNVFLTHPWMRDWWNVYANHHDLWLLVATRGGAVQGIAPLMLERSRDGVRRLAFVGDGEVLPNELDVIARADEREDLVRAFWFYLWQNRAEWDLIDFQDIRKDSPWLDVLASESGDRGLAMHSRVSSTAPYIVLPGSFEEYLQGRGKRTRADFRAQGRRLARDFQAVRFACVKTPIELEVVFEAFVRLHQARWNERGKPGAFASSKFVEFHHAAALTGLRNGTLRMYYLKIDSEIAAVQYCYRSGWRVAGYNTGFDSRWGQYSIGTLLFGYALEESIVEGTREFDFLQGEEGYKQHWATDAREECSLQLAGSHWRGRLVWTRLRSAQNLRAVARRYVPHTARRAVKQILQQTTGQPRA